MKLLRAFYFQEKHLQLKERKDLIGRENCRYTEETGTVLCSHFNGVYCSVVRLGAVGALVGGAAAPGAVCGAHAGGRVSPGANQPGHPRRGH